MSENPSKNPKISIAELEGMSDVTFIVGPKRTRIASFRQVLALANPVFRQMFFGKFQKENEIEIPEFIANDFKLFLNYLYFKEIDLKECDPFEIYMISHKYMVTTLSEMCAEEIVKKICLENIFNIIEWNLTYNDKEIMEKTNNFVKENSIACLTFNKGFAGLSWKTITDLLELDYLKCAEEFLFENLLIWAEAELKIEEKAPTTYNIKRLIAELLPYFHMEIKDDLTFGQYYITSRCNWPFESDKTFNLAKFEDTKVKFYDSWKIRKIIFGLKMTLHRGGNGSLLRTEKFLVRIRSKVTKSDHFEEKFEIKFRDSLVVKDIYFRKPFVTNRKDTYYLTVKFESAQNRLFIENWLTLLIQDFNPAIHNVFIST